MSRFLQLHFLIDYPPSNPNRDDLGRPKSAIIGGRTRQRISSQAIKRAIRTSEVFATALHGHLGERTQRLGEYLLSYLSGKGADEATALKIAREVAAAFGKIKGDKDQDPAQIEQLAFVSPDEKVQAELLADCLLIGEPLPKDKELAKAVLLHADGAVDIAMFGRMLAGNPDYNREAAVQVAHAFTTNAVEIEDDFFTAVDDLKTAAEDAGAGFIGEAGFGAGIYYLYVCVDRALLIRNLVGDAALAARALEALVRAVATASPGGKRNTFANHVRPRYILAEKGDAQPRSLASAFTLAIGPGDQIGKSVAALGKARAEFAAVYGQDWVEEKVLNVGASGSATLVELAAFAADGLQEPSA